MLKVPQQQYIKLMREIEGCSISEIAERANIDWRTAKKYADKEDWTPEVASRNRRSPIMEAYHDIVDTWLSEDQKLPRKQRHSATKVYRRLVEEYQFSGSDRTVRSYISKRKIALALEEAQTYQRLEHPGGEAQVDFCTIQVSKDGQLMEYKLLVASFPYSNAAFVYPVPKENQECFLEGLKQLFMQIGGVPKRIWFDNLSAAVISIKQDGDRQCTDGFLRFTAHHRFEAVFCNANSGNEKGHVENKCGYSRRNWCVPIPVFSTHEALAQDLVATAKADRQRMHYAKAIPIETLWQEESVKLLALPKVPYQVFRLESGKINGYGEIRFEQTNFPILSLNPGAEVLLKIYWNHVEILDQNYQLVGKFSRPYTHKTTDIPWKEVIQGLKRKPRSVNHSLFVRMMPPIVQEFIKQDDLSCRKERLNWLDTWMNSDSLAAIATALTEEDWAQEALPDRMIHRLYAQRHPICPSEFPESFSPPQARDYTPDLTAYDRLHKGGKTEHDTSLDGDLPPTSISLCQ